MTLEEGVIMGLILNGIGLPILFFAYYKAWKNHEDKIRAEEEAKKPRPWDG
ncbi:uncharacterized protein METZ01_LOCUS455760 [marine metagenome]|uniref:Uncharacterized protein n=1 Tax=marine metagenome TaxID=408172 RepID=A0A383A4V1_9ZZZZ